jgi:protein gp37
LNRVTKNDSWVRNPNGTPGYTCNLITGCLLNHDYCFARELANGRLRNVYLANGHIAPLRQGKAWSQWHHHSDIIEAKNDPFYPRFWPERLVELDRWLSSRPELVGVFLNIMSDWAGGWVPVPWQQKILQLIIKHSRHRFYLLTHCTQNLHKWSPFPANCYVGGTAPADGDMTKVLTNMASIKATVRFISIEPMLGAISMRSHPLQGRIEWLIIGTMTCSAAKVNNLAAQYPALTPMAWQGRWTLQPHIEWLEEVAGACSKADVPLFLKDNLSPLLASKDLKEKPSLRLVSAHQALLRQEVPHG